MKRTEREFNDLGAALEGSSSCLRRAVLPSPLHFSTKSPLGSLLLACVLKHYILISWSFVGLCASEAAILSSSRTANIFCTTVTFAFKTNEICRGVSCLFGCGLVVNSVPTQVVPLVTNSFLTWSLSYLDLAFGGIPKPKLSLTVSKSVILKIGCGPENRCDLSHYYKLWCDEHNRNSCRPFTTSSYPSSLPFFPPLPPLPPWYCPILRCCWRPCTVWTTDSPTGFISSSTYMWIVLAPEFPVAIWLLPRFWRQFFVHRYVVGSSARDKVLISLLDTDHVMERCQSLVCFKMPVQDLGFLVRSLTAVK